MLPARPRAAWSGAVKRANPFKRSRHGWVRSTMAACSLQGSSLHAASPRCSAGISKPCQAGIVPAPSSRAGAIHEGSDGPTLLRQGPHKARVRRRSMEPTQQGMARIQLMAVPCPPEIPAKFVIATRLSVANRSPMGAVLCKPAGVQPSSDTGEPSPASVQTLCRRITSKPYFGSASRPKPRSSRFSPWDSPRMTLTTRPLPGRA